MFVSGADWLALSWGKVMAFYVAAALSICINGICYFCMAFIIAHLAFDICLGLFPHSVLGEKKPVFVNISHALDELRRFRFGYKLHTSLVFTSMNSTLFYFEHNS